jgi:hypothetical protein
VRISAILPEFSTMPPTKLHVEVAHPQHALAASRTTAKVSGNRSSRVTTILP